MTLVLVLGLAGLLTAVVAGTARRVLVDERQSVRDYQQTLETLRHLGDHNPATRPSASGGASPATRRRLDAPTRHPAATSAPDRSTTKIASTSRASTPARAQPRRRGGSTAPAPSEPPSVGLVFDETALGAAPAPPPVADLRQLAAQRAAAGEGARPRATARRADRRRSLPALRVPSAAALAVAAAFVVLAVVGAVAGIALSSSRPVTKVAAHAPATRPLSTGRAAAGLPPVIVPVTESSSSATYRLPAAPSTVQLSATGPCWVLATDASGGRVLWTGTMGSGQTLTLPAGSGMLLHLGAAWNVTILAAGRPVRLPTGYLSPFEATFTTA